MRVKIETVGVAMELEMPKENVQKLIAFAMDGSAGEQEPEESADPEEYDTEESEDADLSDLGAHGWPSGDSDDDEPESAAKRREKANSRVESMFGSNWRNQIPDRGSAETRRAYRGFLMIECQECGEVHAFCAKQEQTEYRCKCGGVTRLENLIPMYLKCGCGKEYKYLTNLSREEYTHECLNCKALVRMTMNKRGTAYVTPGGGERKTYGGYRARY